MAITRINRKTLVGCFSALAIGGPVFWNFALPYQKACVTTFLNPSDPDAAQVVEVGSWMGASTCFLAAGLKGNGAKVYAVDNFKGLSIYT